MHAGTLEWNGSDLTRIGKPRLKISRSADPPPPGVATRMLVTLAVTVELEARDPGTIQARAQWLAESLRVPEGILRSSSGSGHTLEWLAVPGDCNLGEALAGRSNSVEMSFTCVEPHGDAAWLGNLTGGTFTPAGSGNALALHAVRDFKEEIKTARHSERNGARSATTTSLGFTARMAQANPAEPLATRLAYLQAQAQAVKSLDTREGLLVLRGTHKIVRVTDFTPVIDERGGTLDVQVACYHITLPDVGVAECLYDTDRKVDEGSGETVIGIRGTIQAETRGIALAKLESIRSAHSAEGTRLVSYSTQDKSIDGADSAGVTGGDWTGELSYTMELRQARSGGHYTLKIATRKDFRNGTRWSYTGSVTAIDAASALTTARAIFDSAAAAYPVTVSSEETLDLATAMDDADTRNFIKLDFGYEFEGPSDGFISAELTVETTQPLTGEWRRTTSGAVVAISREVAEVRLGTLLGTAVDPLETTRRWTTLYLDLTGSDATPSTLVNKLEFTSAVRTTRTRVVAEYSDSTELDKTTLQQTRTLSGTIWSATLAESNAAVDNLAAGMTPNRSSRTQSKVRVAQTTDYWLKLDFSETQTSWMAGRAAYDLREASSTIETISAFNSSVVTQIPFGTPVVQRNVGIVPGRVTTSASAMALNKSTATSWVTNVLATAGANSTYYQVEASRLSVTTESNHNPDPTLDEVLYRVSGSVSYGVA